MDNTMSHTLARAIFRGVDGPSMWPVGNHRTAPKPAARVALFGDDTDTLRGMHAYRMRNRPELFDDAERNTYLDGRADEAERLDLYDWDCHTCRTAVMTPALDTACPRCGATS